MADIKDLIGDIIDTTDNSYPSSPTNTAETNPVLTFDKGSFREKLSLGVLRDIISAMLNDETEDMEGLIDKSIINHLKRDYDGSCYDYLCKSRDKCCSPMLTDVIQEIDDKTEEVANKIALSKDDTTLTDLSDPLELEKAVDNWKEFRENIKKKVSRKIIDSVAAELTQNDDPTFVDNLDDSLKKAKGEAADENNEEPKVPGAPTGVGESCIIIDAAAAIFAESAGSISYDDAINQATVEFALSEMDACFKQYTNQFYAKYSK